MPQHCITVVGASNIDIHATSQAVLVLNDSNPGKMEQTIGGVGRNIAENLARLQIKTKFITAYGDDAFATILKKQAAEVGLDISQSVTSPHCSSSVYICVNQPDGEMYVAVSDMDVCEQLSSNFLQDKLSSINHSDALVLDSNLPEAAITFLAQNCTVPIFADSVSTKKVRRLKDALPRLTGLKINRQEVELLTGLSIEEPKDAITIASALHSLGVKYVLITLGSEGGFLSDGHSMEFHPSMVRDFVNTTGCGDACLAGMVYAYLGGGDCRAILRSSMAMAGICAADSKAVSPAVSPEALTGYLKQF